MAFSDLSASDQRTLISRVRIDSTDAVQPFLVNAEEMTIAYDGSTGNYAYVVYATIRLMIARLSAMYPRMGDKREREVLDARLKALECDLETWRMQAGVSNGGAPVTRTLDTGIDSYDATLWSNG